ncbi:hypothetical protein M422DRAFT_23923 [Sphaerobolus stellatus SS14]|nr:hypothetical protein M422DRAFT_23923 [Sphaerobolus stellatus SS14]
MEPKEKTLLPTLTRSPSASRAPRSAWNPSLLRVVILAAIFATLHCTKSKLGYLDLDVVSVEDAAKLCPQTEPVRPSAHGSLYEEVGSLLKTEDFKLRAAEWLGGAVRVPTESYDAMGPIGEDPRWETFGPFHDYLLKAFPLIHTTLKQTKVNTYGLVYHWQGDNSDLKPVLLTAHQDVVPVDPKTVEQWVQPPYSGYFDGTYVWGRGSSDDKSGLISIMSTVETLLEKGFNPKRSVVLAFGFDEETSGLFGAHNISEYLLANYGENGFAMLIDEGGGMAENYGAIIASPAVGEKGYLDVRVQVNTPGGHSSVPPPHTGIGILSSFLVALENDPIVPHLSRDQVVYKMLKCTAQAPDIPARLRKDIVRSVKSDKALRRVEKAVLSTLRPLIGTTQAIDLISGGVKTNALPEQSSAVVNHRIADDSSVDAVKERVTNILGPLASKFNLSVEAFGSDLTGKKPAYGSLILSDAWGTALQPAPVTPSIDSTPYNLLSATIKASLFDAGITDKQVIVAPGIMTGNTDTRYYWKLTPHIFRYSHHGKEDNYPGGGVHTVNEAMKIDGILKMIRFFTLIILNTDETSL